MDKFGNEAECTRLVKVIDSTDPVIPSCPQYLAATTDENKSYFSFSVPEVNGMDNSDAELTTTVLYLDPSNLKGWVGVEALQTLRLTGGPTADNTSVFHTFRSV